MKRLELIATVVSLAVVLCAITASYTALQMDVKQVQKDMDSMKLDIGRLRSAQGDWVQGPVQAQR